MNTRRRILLIDDDRDDQVNFCRCVYDLDPGAECLIAGNGGEALLHLRTLKPRPDIIFLDLNMPYMNGLEYLSEIRASRSFDDIPIVVFTTSATEYEIEQCRRFGVARFLLKPPDITILKKELEQILTQHFYKSQAGR